MSPQAPQGEGDRCPCYPVPGLRRSLRVHNATQHRQGPEVKPNRLSHNRPNRAKARESANERSEGFNEQPEVISESIEEDTDQSNRSTPETEAEPGMAANAGRGYQINFYHSIVYNINI